MKPRHAERLAVAALVVVGHLSLLASWRLDAPAHWRTTPAADQAALRVRLLIDSPTPPPMAQAGKRTRPVTLGQQARAAAAIAPAPVPHAEAGVFTPHSPSVQTAEAPPVAASAVLDLQLRVPRGDNERSGLGLPRNSMVRQALNDPRSNSHADPTQALPHAVASSAKGDCLKGEYFTPLAGLLALPFLAYAVAADQCKPQR